MKDAAKLNAAAITATATHHFSDGRERGSFERMLHAANTSRQTWRERARTDKKMRLLLKSVHSGARCRTNAVMAKYAPNDVQASPHHRENSCLYSRAYRIQNTTTRIKVSTSWR